MSNFTPENVLHETESIMSTALKSLKKQFAAIRTGKASPSLVSDIMVDYYGTPTRLQDIAGVTVPEPMLLVIQPWDQTAVKAIEKAILVSDVGISPVSDGKIIRLPIPELSEQRRKNMVKKINELTEEGRIEIRNIRRETNSYLKKAEKASDITEDDLRDMLDDVQKLTNKYIGKLETSEQQKEKELMTI
ncbi:MAG: ribosome recycling factor [Verrucomicrobiota bacterium]|nr:ribosome recycling factor [Verrucomicrobiota bacterium]